jgi:hypothetical protein
MPCVHERPISPDLGNTRSFEKSIEAALTGLHSKRSGARPGTAGKRHAEGASSAANARPYAVAPLP